MAPGTIAPDDPRADDVRAVLQRHLAHTQANSPPEDMHALDVEGLTRSSIAFFSCRDDDGVVLGVGAIHVVDEHLAELKSMHTTAEARGRGVGRAMVEHLVEHARGLGIERVSLETGSQEAFAAARSLYASCGFESCGPFGTYVDSPASVFMTRALR